MPRTNGKLLFIHRSEQYIYYYRRAIPNCLKSTFGNAREIKKSLKTREQSVAMLRHHQINTMMERLIQMAGRGENKGETATLAEHIKALRFKKESIAEREYKPDRPLWSGIVSYLRGQPLLDRHNRIIMPLPISFDGEALKGENGKAIDSFHISLALSIADQQGIPKIHEELEQTLGSMKLGFTYQYNFKDGTLTPYLSMEEYDPAQDGKALADGPSAVRQYPDHFADLNLVPMRFTDLVKKFFDANPRSDKSLKAYKATYKLFEELSGNPVSTQMGHTVFSEFREKLARMPINAKRRFPDVSTKKLIEKEYPMDERLSVATINKHMKRISQLCKWATHEGHMAQNFGAEKHMKSGAKAGRRGKESFSPFTMKELEQYFSGPIHKNNQRQGIYLEMFWLPLIALYSGMRLEEIAELQTADMREVEDEKTSEMVWVFDVNADGHNKAVKNDPSVRLVAVHPELIKMGLLEHHHKRVKEKQQTLWNLECVFSKDGTRLGYAQNIGKRLRYYLRKTVGIEQGDKVFHSFRHTVMNNLRNNGVREDYLKAFVGHSLEGTAGTVYFDGLQPSVLKQTAEHIAYPKLDLSHLYRP